MNGDQVVLLELTVNEVNVILIGLMELQAKVSIPIHNKIHQQATEQLNPPIKMAIAETSRDSDTAETLV